MPSAAHHAPVPGVVQSLALLLSHQYQVAEAAVAPFPKLYPMPLEQEAPNVSVRVVSE